MAAIAAFAKSDQGQDYAAICHYWGVDPVAGMFADDEVVAVNFRAALMLSSLQDEPEAPPGDREAEAQANERLWLAGG